jgi:hypothetical protein
MAVVKADEVFQTYSEVLPGGASLAEGFLKGVVASVQKQELPVSLATEQAATSWLRGVTGKNREFLVLRPESKTLQDFRMWIYAQPIGLNLAIGWFMTVKKSFLKDAFNVLASASMQVSVMPNLDLFENADLVALMDSIHTFAIMDGVDSIAGQLGYDKSRIGRSSKGLFGVAG